MKRSAPRAVNGIVLLDKPADFTSNQALQRVRRLYRAGKAGHTGSLDPLATGMLPVCLGAATKVCSYLLDARKSYRVTACLDRSTDTGDAHGSVIGENPAVKLSKESVKDALEGFIGKYEQVPPMYSALKYKGQRLYKLARQGIEVPRKPRTVRIFRLTLRRLQAPQLEFDVTCSKGAYVRTLVEDIARALGTLGHVQALRRTSVEPFNEAELITLPTLEKLAREDPEALDRCLLPADRALTSWPRIVVAAAQCGHFTNGRAVAADPDWPEGQVRVYAPDEEFLGIGEVTAARRLGPRRVFAVSGNTDG